MKKFRRLSAFVMVLTLLVSLSISVWAADYDAATMDDLWSAFNDASGEDVNINVTADISGYDPETDGYYGVSGQEGINYNISTENDSSLGDISFWGGESITIDTELNGMIHFANTNATVNGDVNGDLNVYEAEVTVSGNVEGYVSAGTDSTVDVSGNADSASAYDNGVLNIGGDVNGDLNAYEAEVTVSGNVEGYVSAGTDSTVDVSGNADSASAYDNGVLNIGGDVNDGLWAAGDATVDVDGDVNGNLWACEDATVNVGGDVNGNLGAVENATVNVGGDVNGADGNPDDVDYSDPHGYSDGYSGIYADGNATVNVEGDVNGGDSYGTYGYGGDGIDAWGEATVNVGGNVTGGNVTADPETVTDAVQSLGGDAIRASSTATVSVGGDATGGDTNGSNGCGGDGVRIFCEDSEAEPGSVAVAGAVSSGEGEREGTGIVVDKYDENAQIPEISAGSCDSISAYGLTEEEFKQLVSDIEATYTQKTYTIEDFFNGILWQIRNAKAGDEITVNMGTHIVLATSIIEAVKEADVKLILKWNGGDDLVIDKNFSAEIEGSSIALADLAELLKK